VDEVLQQQKTDVDEDYYTGNFKHSSISVTVHTQMVISIPSEFSCEVYTFPFPPEWW